VHTTGSGVVDKALKLKVDPLDYAVAYYLKPDSYFPHYVCGWDGHLVQVADERERAQHVGFAERGKYLTGDWEKLLPASLVARWRERWPGFKSPAHLFPGSSVNNVFVGVELLPTPTRDRVYGRFTLAQHQMVSMLAKDLGERAKLPARWWQTSRLLGHEDLTPLSRSNKGGGWDPGALRVDPDFHWGAVLQLLDASA